MFNGSDGVALHTPETKVAPGGDLAFRTFAGARAPDRLGAVNAHGVRLATYEWGDAHAPPVLLLHGALDFARTFDVFAPLLADAGFRVVSYDQRGHGDSSHAELYGWVADERDLLCVANSISVKPIPVIGHSKGGSLLIHAAEALPHRFTRFACIDGMPFRSPHPDSAMRERQYMSPKVISGWLAHRHTAATATRKPGSLQDLAQRRARMNPRLSHEWLCYLVTQGAHESADGWRWKLDPAIRPGGFGPMRSRWMTDRLPGFPIPLMALFSTVDEPMGWDCKLEDIQPYLPSTAQAMAMPDTGHFIHIERPHETARLVIDFLQS
ncbi:MAG: alpha/beta hydrolase [Ottowia sp.]|uniref:alpha/beta fold hydrolase n=1 Tax=Ottowia sp. TaxID=1898956 RepID=UPI003C73D58F